MKEFFLSKIILLLHCLRLSFLDSALPQMYKKSSLVFSNMVRLFSSKKERGW